MVHILQVIINDEMAWILSNIKVLLGPRRRRPEMVSKSIS